MAHFPAAGRERKFDRHHGYGHRCHWESGRRAQTARFGRKAGCFFWLSAGRHPLWQCSRSYLGSQWWAACHHRLFASWTGIRSSPLGQDHPTGIPGSGWGGHQTGSAGGILYSVWKAIHSQGRRKDLGPGWIYFDWGTTRSLDRFHSRYYRTQEDWGRDQKPQWWTRAKGEGTHCWVAGGQPGTWGIFILSLSWFACTDPCHRRFFKDYRWRFSERCKLWNGTLFGKYSQEHQKYGRFGGWSAGFFQTGQTGAGKTNRRYSKTGQWGSRGN